VTTRPVIEIAAIPARRRSSRLVWGGVGVALAAVALLASLAWSTRAKAPAGASAAPIEAAPPPRLATAEPPAPPPPSAAPAAPDPTPAAIPVASPSPSSAIAPPSASVARPRPAPVTVPKASCDPPYSVDAEGIRHYKKGCLR
jgi:serine/threonine-protein kinase